MANFSNKDHLKAYLDEKGSGILRIAISNMKGYEGMVFDMGLIFDLNKRKKYELDLEWISYGLDLYGENLLENYLYTFQGLDPLLDYLNNCYAIAVSDIPMGLKVDINHFPNPIKDEDKKSLFQANWERFQKDFRTGIFLDPSLNLIYSTQDI